MTNAQNGHDAEARTDVVADTGASAALLGRLIRELGFSGPWHRPLRGSALLAISEGEVLKVMAPGDAAMSAIEVSCLRRLEGALPVATPRVLDAGVVAGWPYLRMARLPGLELTETWSALTHAAQLSLATQLGEALAILYGTAAPPEVPRLDWPAWRAQQLGVLDATQSAKGCPPPLLSGLRDFVAQQPLEAGRTAWLHTEVMREHLLVQETPVGWRLSGLFDFEPSWVAPVDYEFASVGLFFSAGDARLLREVQRAAGVSIAPERLFALAMLHRYANLNWYHRRLGGPPSHAALAAAWFGCTPAVLG